MRGELALSAEVFTLEAATGYSSRGFFFTSLASLSLPVVFSHSQMEALVSALPYAEIILSVLLIVGIVLQQRGATLGGAFGGDNFASTFYKRRGAERFLFNATILAAILLVLSAIANFLLSGS